MKEIWINLELYIKTYEFYIFRDFFWICLNLFRFLNDKNELKKGKKRFYFYAGPRGCDVASKATWQHLAGPRSAYAGLYIFIFYIVYSI